MSSARPFVVATPSRSVCDDNARALFHHHALRFIALGTRRGTVGIPPEHTRLRPLFGLLNYAAVKTVSQFRAESFRFRLLPWFDRWVKRLLEPGDNIISSYGYTNECFQWVRAHGGKTLVDAGNSHPEHFWEILTEEHRRWKCDLPPVSPFWNRRAREMMAHVDYVLSPSSFVTGSFLEHGFKPEQILRNIYPVDLSCFAPDSQPRTKSRPLTIISTGALSLRKGTPYMLEAFRMVHQRHPSAKFLLMELVSDSAAPIVAQYRDLPIEWSPALPHSELAARLRSADIFVLPSLEEGLVRTALEAMACGLPVILTPNTGANDFVIPGQSGSVVPIRDARAIADAILEWGERIMSSAAPPQRLFDSECLSFAYFEREFITQLKAHGLL
jgi:glycosyltransferase involved in cell wall biosynthesis